MHFSYYVHTEILKGVSYGWQVSIIKMWICRKLWLALAWPRDGHVLYDSSLHSGCVCI